MWNFLGTVSEYLSWLYHGREWATWELIGVAVVLLVVPVWIFKRLRRRPAKRAYGRHFLDGASVIGINLADQSRKRHGGANPGKTRSKSSAGGRDKQEKTDRKASDWRKAVDQVRQKPTEKKLETELAELAAVYEQPQEKAGEINQTTEPATQTTSSPALTDEHKLHQNADTEQSKASAQQNVGEPIENGKSTESLEQRITELTADNEQLRRQLAETRQTTEPLEEKLAGQTCVNEQLRKEVEHIKQAEERLEQRIAELMAANEQLKQEVSTGAGAARAKKDDDYEQRHRVVEGVNEKLCNKCGQWKTEDQYHKHASSRDGLANRCKQCRSEATRKRREKREAAQG